ncbi:MAG: integrase arm-type DNA-binding domain-containing protein, partial [Acidobacteriota bacterium]
MEQRAPATGRVEIRDSLSPLILRITHNGRRSFIVRVRIKGNRQPVRLTFDSPAHLSVLEAARAWAVNTVSMCRRGEDPRSLRTETDAEQKAEAERRERNRFGAVADAFLEKYAVNNRSYYET